MPRYLSRFMQVHYGINALPFFHKSVLTIGTFDGVHKGHQKVIDALCDEAKKIGGESVIITFDPHPRKVVQPNQPLQLINTLNEKIYLLRRKGIDHLVVVPFTEAFACITATDYIAHFLVKNFMPATIIIGYDHHFGKDRHGSFEMLHEQKEKWGYHLIEIPPHLISEITISSTNIRNALLNSDVETANDLLGYPFFFSGKVVSGDALGRTLGYPTANLYMDDEDKIIPGDGVYAVHATFNGIEKKGMMSIGNRPTLEHSQRKTEVYLFDFNASIYGVDMCVSVRTFMRPQLKFESLQELSMQMNADSEKALDLLR